MRAIVRGWAPTCIGYSLQGLGKFGFYEVFKVLYTNMIGEVCLFVCLLSVYYVHPVVQFLMS